MSRIYFCGPFREMEMKVSRGALARAEALVAGHPEWWNVTRWPEDKEFKGPDPKIKNPKAPKKTKKGGRKK